MAQDYLAMVTPKKGDKLDFGIKGMKWGVRRSKEQLAADKNSPTKPPENESSSDRYNRLLTQAKKSGGNSLTDEELRFVTSRGDAIRRVQQLSNEKPSWISDTAQQVLKNAAKQSLQSVANSVAKKYINDAIIPKKSGS